MDEISLPLNGHKKTFYVKADREEIATEGRCYNASKDDVRQDQKKRDASSTVEWPFGCFTGSRSWHLDDR